MNLYPKDLGAKRQIALLWRRARRAGPAPDHRPPRVGAWERFWIGEDLYNHAPETVPPALRAMRRAGAFWSVVGLAPLPAAVCLFIALGQSGNASAPLALLLGPLWAGLVAGAYPRALFDRAHRRLNDTPITAAEVAGLLPQAHDELERAYLTLLMDVARQEVAPQSEADLRPALRALGDAIDKLPATRVVADSPDILTEVLRRTAAETLQAPRPNPTASSPPPWSAAPRPCTGGPTRPTAPACSCAASPCSARKWPPRPRPCAPA